MLTTCGFQRITRDYTMQLGLISIPCLRSTSWIKAATLGTRKIASRLIWGLLSNLDIYDTMKRKRKKKLVIHYSLLLTTISNTADSIEKRKESRPSLSFHRGLACAGSSMYGLFRLQCGFQNGPGRSKIISLLKLLFWSRELFTFSKTRIEIFLEVLYRWQNHCIFSSFVP